jgi:hypothetical protein
VPRDTIERLRAILELRMDRLDAQRRRDGAGPGGDADRADLETAVHRLRREVISAERRALAELRDQREVPAQVLAGIQRDIDLDEIRLH